MNKMKKPQIPQSLLNNIDRVHAEATAIYSTINQSTIQSNARSNTQIAILPKTRGSLKK